VTSPGSPVARPDPSPTQAAPVDSAVQGADQGILRGPANTAGGAASSRRTAIPREQADDERERKEREKRLQASEERIRRLVRDICTGCDYGPAPSKTRNTKLGSD
jgi:hypothetical protein